MAICCLVIPKMYSKRFVLYYMVCNRKRWPIEHIRKLSEIVRTNANTQEQEQVCYWKKKLINCHKHLVNKFLCETYKLQTLIYVWLVGLRGFRMKQNTNQLFGALSLGSRASLMPNLISTWCSGFSLFKTKNYIIFKL